MCSFKFMASFFFLITFTCTQYTNIPKDNSFSLNYVTYMYVLTTDHWYWISIFCALPWGRLFLLLWTFLTSSAVWGWDFVVFPHPPWLCTSLSLLSSCLVVMLVGLYGSIFWYYQSHNRLRARLLQWATILRFVKIKCVVQVGLELELVILLPLPL